MTFVFELAKGDGGAWCTITPIDFKRADLGSTVCSTGATRRQFIVTNGSFGAIIVCLQSPLLIVHVITEIWFSNYSLMLHIAWYPIPLYGTIPWLRFPWLWMLHAGGNWRRRIAHSMTPTWGLTSLEVENTLQSGIFGTVDSSKYCWVGTLQTRILERKLRVHTLLHELAMV